ncbi:SKP1/ASK-interacting protein 16 [Tasmannia lanceolata]|uniref:SKP1/ASK-interacting protein 16 n=1 Tax=Tasmannia lanceolata TaxID=3420 RepID=UPI004062F5F7
MGEMGLESLGDLVTHIIISKLGAKNAAVIGCVNKRFRVSASEDDLWRKFCTQDLDLSLPQDPFGNPTPSFKVAYITWKESFGMYPISLVRRAKKYWTSIKNWVALNFPEAEKTLRRGASEAELKELERILGVKLPIPTRLLYRFCDGQDIPHRNPSQSEEEDPTTTVATGLIGGYGFYDHVVNVFLLPLRQVIKETIEFVHQMGFSTRSQHIVMAACPHIEKLFFLHCESGQLYVGTGNLFPNGEMMPCVPDALIRSVHDLNGDQQQDGMLLWLEEHGRRLQNGVIGIREEGKVRSISLFPENLPHCTTAVTNGVQIRASAVFVPELSNLKEVQEKYWFSYSIRMRLLPQGCTLDGMYFNSCQLYWRRWINRANDVILSEVNGEAVIGKFPLLYPDGEEFVYESCISMRDSSGTMEGAFTFYPGRLRDPKGRPFDVEVAVFPLEKPDYIF